MSADLKLPTDIAKDAEWMLATWTAARYNNVPHEMALAGQDLCDLVQRLCKERDAAKAALRVRPYDAHRGHTWRSLKMRRNVYIAHPLSGDTATNLRNASYWVGWAAAVQGVAPSATWQVLAAMFPETPQYRTMGLECDIAAIAGCDEVYLCGGRISDGMKLESEFARDCNKLVWDLSHLGPLPPAGPYVPAGEDIPF